MNPMDDELARLFRAARTAPLHEDVAPPYGLATRVLAAWRSPRPREFWTAGVLVRGVLAAGVVTVLSLLPWLTESATPYSDSQQLADSTVQTDLTP